MKICSKDKLFSIELKENRINKLIIENKSYYRNFISNLYIQSKLGEGELILFDGVKEISFNKNVNVVFQPIYIEINDKKYKNRINDSMIEKYKNGLENETIANIIKELNRVGNIYALNSDFPITYNDFIEVKNIFSLLNFRIEFNENIFINNLVDYILSIRKLDNKNIFVLLNLSDYLNDDEIELFYRNMLYEKVDIIVVEPRENKKYDFESIKIIDNDLCVLDFYDKRDYIY